MKKSQVTERMNRLKKLSDGNLIDQLKTLRKCEKATTLEILLHLIEIGRRKLHVEEGYSSMFDYCRRALGYSESAANRRVHTARCIGDFPEVYELLVEGEVNLSTVSCVSGVLTEANRDALLSGIRGKSRREVEQIVSQLRPPSRVRERVRPVAQRTARDAGCNKSLFAAKPTRAEENGPPEEWQVFDRRGGGQELTTSGVDEVDAVDSTIRSQEAFEQLFELKFAIDAEGMQMLEEVKVLLSTTQYRGVELGKLMKTVMAYYLEHHSAKRKHARRQQRRARRKQKTGAQCAGTNEAIQTKAKTPGDKPTVARDVPKEKVIVAHDDKTPGATRSRHIPVALRDEVYVRDGGRCTFVGPDGVRCDSTWGVQHDHILPWAMGGDHSSANVRLLCSTHNQLLADQVFGRGFMDGRRRGAKEKGQGGAGWSG